MVIDSVSATICSRLSYHNMELLIKKHKQMRTNPNYKDNSMTCNLSRRSLPGDNARQYHYQMNSLQTKFDILDAFLRAGKNVHLDIFVYHSN